MCGAFAHDRICPALLAGVDVAVIPSLWWDCAPLMVAECLAGRVPVLASRMGGIAEAVARRASTACWWTAATLRRLPPALDRLAGEPGLLERLQAGIRQPRAFAAYVDELERYYAGRAALGVRPAARRRSRCAGAATRASRPASRSSMATSATTSRPRASPSSGSRERASAGAPAAGDPPARSRCATSGRPTSRPSPARLAVIQPWEFGAIPREWVGADRSATSTRCGCPASTSARCTCEDGVDPERVHVIGNGVDLETFTPDGRAARAGRARRVPLPVRRRHDPAQGRRAPDRGVPPRPSPAATTSCLVIKDFGADAIYRGADRGRLVEYSRRRRAAADRVPVRGRLSDAGAGGALPRLRRDRAALPRARASACPRWRRWPAACR